MAKSLFRLTIDVHNIITGNTRISMPADDSLPLAKFTDEKVEELNHQMKILLRSLKKNCPKSEIKYYRGYVRNNLVNLKGTKNLQERLESFTGDLFYMSDRWCYERYRYIEIAWALLYAELKCYLCFKKQVVKADIAFTTKV